MTTNKVGASIIICTRNRSKNLQSTLSSIACVQVPGNLPAELLVVDNASTDDTAEVIKSFKPRNLATSYIYESQPGQVRARNTGMAAARGQIVLFTDDDVRVPSNWIESMCSPIISGSADAIVGSIKMAVHLERSWMTSLHRAWLACPPVAEAGPAESLIGANMAFSKEVLKRVPGFDVELGPGALGFYDDTLFSWQLLKAGFKMVTAPEVVVTHCFDESRLLRASFLDTAKKHGRSLAYVTHHWKHETLEAVPRRLLRAVLRLFYWRFKTRREPRNPEGILDWEAAQIPETYYYAHYLKERRRPHNYEPFGLVKRGAKCEAPVTG